MEKKELTMTEFRIIVKEEVIKLKRRIVLENEKNKLKKELESILNESKIDENRYEEGMLRDLGNKIMPGTINSTDQNREEKQNKMRQDFSNFVKKYKLPQPDEAHMDDLMKQAEADGFNGRVTYNNRTKELLYYPSTKKDSGPGMNTKGGGYMY